MLVFVADVDERPGERESAQLSAWVAPERRPRAARSSAGRRDLGILRRRTGQAAHTHLSLTTTATSWQRARSALVAVLPFHGFANSPL